MSDARIPESVLRADFRRLYPVSDIAKGLVLQPPMLFDNFLLSKTLTLISAEPGAGKTWLMLEMLLCLELDEPLFGLFKPHLGHHRCLFIGMDSSAWDVSKQFMKLCRGRGLTKEQVSKFNSDMLLRGDGRFTLTDKSRLDWLRAWIATTNTNVIFLDTYRAINVGDENNSLQMEAVMEAMRFLRDDTGVSLITSHHTRKSQPGFDDEGNDSARGSSAITGALDFHIRLARTRRGTILTMPKGREDFDGWEDVTYQREVLDTSFGKGVRFTVSSACDVYGSILDGLNRGITMRPGLIEHVQITLGLPLDKSAKFVDNGLRKLKIEGLAKPIGRGAWEAIKKGDKV